MTEDIKEINVDKETIIKLFGNLDENIHKIEKQYNVSILNRDGKLRIIGNDNDTEKTKKVLETLIKLCDTRQNLTMQDIDYCIAMNETNDVEKVVELDKDIIARTIQGKPIKPKTIKQKEYIDSIEKNMVTFAVGPAGTGKTFLGMCMAVKAFKNGDVQRLILTRPAIEAGEKLGFLPGDLQSKIDPYLRPLYDALYQLLGIESFNSNLEKGTIEVAPLAYMRGRTLDNAFIILDEAQNTTVPQMKMFLTRIGFNSKVIVTGDDTQIDLPKGVTSGLKNAIKVLDNIEGIKFVNLTSKDVVRHPIVQKIVMAYDKFEMKNKNKHVN